MKKCDQCQRFVPNIHQSGRILNPLSSPWPFAQWDLEIVKPFPKATGNKRYLLVVTDYFTKWVEAEPLVNIRNVDAKSLSRKTLLPGSGSLTPSSQIMVFSSIVSASRDTTVNWELRIDILPHLTPRGMGKPRLLIRS